MDFPCVAFQFAHQLFVVGGPFAYRMSKTSNIDFAVVNRDATSITRDNGAIYCRRLDGTYVNEAVGAILVPQNCARGIFHFNVMEIGIAACSNTLGHSAQPRIAIEYVRRLIQQYAPTFALPGSAP